MPTTRILGLIGNPLRHSHSVRFFKDFFYKHAITGWEYQNFPLCSIDAFPALLAKHPRICGLNVTIPYKRDILRFCHQQSEGVRHTGAANCLSIQHSTVFAYNTDINGFQKAFQERFSLTFPPSNRVLILGTGGGARAVRFACEQWGMHCQFVSRVRTENTLSYTDLNADVLSQHHTIIQTTPVGMYPHTDDCLPFPFDTLTPHHRVFDLIYNPAETIFLQRCKQAGAAVENGYSMLIYQALAAWDIWRDNA